MLLPALLLVSCASSFEKVKALEDPIIERGFTFQAYDEISIHTELQNNYLNDNYTNIANYANGTSELSRPQTFTLSWDFTTSGEETVDSYLLSVTHHEDLSSFETYTCETSQYTFTNLMIGTTYYYFVTANVGNTSYSSSLQSFITESTGPRNLYVSGVTNARDLGGYTNIHGQKVKQGLVYRMGQLNNSYSLSISSKINPAGRKTLLDDFKVKSEIDLREITNNENGALYDSILGKEVNYFPCRMGWDVTHIAQNETDAMRKAFKVFTNQNNYPVVFHCAIGTDRTGVVAFYLNALLGLKDVDIYRDYLFSNFGNIGGSRGIDNINAHFAYLNTFVGSNIQEKAFTYFQTLGFTEQELNNICHIMLED